MYESTIDQAFVAADEAGVGGMEFLQPGLAEVKRLAEMNLGKEKKPKKSRKTIPSVSAIEN